MKAISVFLFLVSTVFAESKPVTLTEITDYVKTQNYYVLENAQKVYQAKQTVQLARRNLLPKLHIWGAVESVVSPLSLLGMIEDIAPFLVPNNWIRVKEEKLFSKATELAYKSLFSNEVLTARALFFQSFLEEQLYKELGANKVVLNTAFEILQSREAMGVIPVGSSRQIELQKLNLQDDLQGLKRVISENRSQLAYILGFHGNDEAVPTDLNYLLLSEDKPLQYADYEVRLVAVSTELQQYDALIEAAKSVKKERYYSFLGGSTLSRGSGGTVFDGLPQQDGLGFGIGQSVRIVKSQREILFLQKKGVEETLRKNLKLLVDSYNLDLEVRKDAIKRVNIAKDYYNSLVDRLKLGDEIDIFTLVQASKSQVEANSAYHAIETRMLTLIDRLNRLMFWDVYKDEPAQ